MTVPMIWLLIPLLIASSPRVFSENSICTRKENYTVTSMETYDEPVIVNTFTWCLQIPPRCPKERAEIRHRYRVKTEVKTRDVQECCEGYEQMPSDEETGIKCRPFCEKCLIGACISPGRCRCIPGHQGDNCDIPCPAGTWGVLCKKKCNCAEDVPCNPVNGRCICPQGLRGLACNESCPSDRWGAECAFPCECENSNKCHPETGRCIELSDFENITRSRDEENSVAKDFTSAIHFWATENTTEDDYEMLATTENPTSVENTWTMWTSNQKTKTRDKGNSSTPRPVIVLVSVPERRRNVDKDQDTFFMKNPFMKHIDDNNIGPKTDYVKNIHKDVQPAPIPLDIALIVVASIVSLGLTSVAVVMVLHMRSKLLEAARASIYEEARAKSQQNVNGTKISSIVNGALPQTPIQLGPIFSTPEPRTMLRMDNIDSCNYANGAATIGLHLSGNLHDDHYDRPPSTRIRLQGDFDTEHVYDEIPLQSNPLSSRDHA
ncbi:uncharacterized protein LOC108630738 isoform X2 [Ceratina calcarata]|uniref:Uncharacterized protein LOC108630738 isoform X2 n=1 Tax=Ceratina calcarata TaxID=156304 RepID=A0AAJ7JCM6_9HYME|nr:uncharacterized protein LOC108630738 isoform X2 [Ceratina calcarata]